MKQKFEVCGRTAQLGHKPGETFEADLSSSQKGRMVARGAIKETEVTGKVTDPHFPDGNGETPPKEKGSDK